MALTKEHLHQLIALQEKDGALDKLKAEMDKIPAQASSWRAKLDAAKARGADAKNQTLTLEKRKKEKEIELSQKEEAVKKHSMELNQVKTNDAFKALQQEIDKAKAEGSQVETAILEIMEELDSRRRQEKAFQAELASEEKAINAELAALEARLAELKGRYDGAKAARDSAAAPLPAEAMRVYDHVRSRGKLDAVAPIEGGHCGACRMALAPQVIVEATKAKQLVTCESCQRIIYRPEALVAKPAA